MEWASGSIEEPSLNFDVPESLKLRHSIVEQERHIPMAKAILLTYLMAHSGLTDWGSGGMF